MDKKIVATPVPPEQPEAPRSIIRISSAGLLLGVLAIVVGSFWSVVGPWLIAVGILILIMAASLLAAYWRPSFDHTERRDMRKLYDRGQV
jgi:membrane protein implicated in regulation of membrane protease activity